MKKFNSGDKVLVFDEILKETMVGVFVIQDSSYLICQNTHNGASIPYKYGYRYSWFLGTRYQFTELGENILNSRLIKIIFL